MKKILLLVVFLVTVYSVNAQMYDYNKKSKNKGLQGVRFGVKAGLSFSSIDGGESYDYSPKFGFFIGLIEELRISKNMSVQAEFLFSRQGGNDDNDNSIGYTLDYFTVPLILKVYIGKIFNLQFGPKFSYNLGSEGINYEAIPNYDKSITFVNDYDYTANGFDFGFDFGAAYELNDNIAVNIRYYWGITEIREDKDDRNLVMQFGVVAKI